MQRGMHTHTSPSGLLLLVSLAFGHAGCGAASGGGAARVPQGELDQYFVGTQVIRLPDGTEREGGSVVAHRTLRPEERAIVEEVVVRDAAGALEAHAVRLEIDDDDRHFVLRPSEGDTSSSSFSGEGELTGDPWSWTAWHVQTRLPDGTVVVTDDVLSATDLASESRVLGADGTPSVVIRQVLTRVTRERYEAERAALGAESPSTPAPASEPNQQ
jgi:hypothetical protein